MGAIFERTIVASDNITADPEAPYTITKMLETLHRIKVSNGKLHAELHELYKKSARIYAAVNIWFIIWSSAVLVIGIMSTNALTGKVGFWKLFASVMHIASVAIMFFSTILLTYYSIQPKFEQLPRYGLSLGLHFFGCLGNLALLWTFSTNDWSGSNQQFSLVATVVPGLIDGTMFAVLASVYCIVSRLYQLNLLVQAKNYSRETGTLRGSLNN